MDHLRSTTRNMSIEATPAQAPSGVGPSIAAIVSNTGEPSVLVLALVLLNLYNKASPGLAAMAQRRSHASIAVIITRIVMKRFPNVLIASNADAPVFTNGNLCNKITNGNLCNKASPRLFVKTQA